MAGIGFELNKLFKEKGISAKARAFGTSSVILAGPLLMGIALIILLLNFAEGQGMSQEGRNLLVVMITYATLGSLFITGVISLPLTRYVSDMMYLGKNRRIIPALLGSISIVLPAGCALYLILLVRSDLSLAVIFLNLALLAEISAIFLVNGFLTAIRNYKGLLGSYAASLAITLVFACFNCLFCHCRRDQVLHEVPPVLQQSEYTGNGRRSGQCQAGYAVADVA